MPEDAPCKYQGEKVLLVEGKNECHVVMALCAAHNLPKNFGIYDCESDTKLIQRMNALMSAPNRPNTIGVVIDADENGPQSRWDAIRNKLNKYAYKFPPKPASNGSIIQSQSNLPRLGIWIMPDNAQSGMLEDFCLNLAKPDAVDFAKTCVSEAKGKGATTFKSNHESKAVVHTYLAWQDEPGSPLGLAIKRHALKSDSKIAIQFTGWLKELFEIETIETT